MNKIILFALFTVLFEGLSHACDSCGAVLSRAGSETGLTNETKRFAMDITVEQRNWDTENSRAIHNLHHDGHHAHNRTHEEYYHVSMTWNAADRLVLHGEIPYIHRSFTEVDDHAILGSKQTSEGWGDLKVTGLYKLWQEGGSYAGPMTGIKFPTGSTGELNSAGTLIESELQPGSGSYDPLIGAGFGWVRERWSVNGNILYTFKTEGDNDFEHGDLFSVYVAMDYDLGKLCSKVSAKTGLDLNIQEEDRQVSGGVEIADSGGTTILLGPSLTVQLYERVQFFGNILFPVYQNLGGIHQEVDFVWHGGIKINW